jgi:putative membrane protein
MLGGAVALMSLQCAEQPTPQNIEPATPPPPVTATDPALSQEPTAAAATSAEAKAEPKQEASEAKPSKPVDAPQSTLNDAQIGAITEGANGAEIEQAKLARSKSKNQKVLQFASMMISHHQEAQKKQAKLKLTTAESPISAQLAEDANRTLTSLKKKDGAEFDRAYMQAQIEEHQSLLDALNSRLLPSVTSAELRAYLEEVKSRVEQHLDAARSTDATLAAPAPAANRPNNAASSAP